MERTIDNTAYIGQDAVGYMVNTFLDPHAVLEVKKLQQLLKEEYGDAIWLTPPDSLHITLMDWLAPRVDYGSNKDALFEEFFSHYDAILTEALNEIPTIDAVFDGIIISPSAIAITSSNALDTFNRIRQAFVSKVSLLPDTKQPPAIVHSTIARFIGKLTLHDVEKFVSNHSVTTENKITDFQLVREARLPMLQWTTLKRYPLVQD